MGKTLVSAGLVWALRRRGLDVGVMKPVESGVAGGAHADAELLRRVAGSSDPLTDISPYRFGPPLAPLVAARRQRTRISLATIVQRFHRLASRHDIVVVEGVGGLMVPLSIGKIPPCPPLTKGGWGDFSRMRGTYLTTTLDLARALGLPLLLVIGNKLGAINHALLTVQVAKAHGLKFLGGVINQTSQAQDEAIRTNPHILKELLELPAWAVVPYLRAKETAWETIGRNLERTGFLDSLIRPSQALSHRQTT
ncbi:MAG: dethiobiotin synthase [Nitrospirota bacterium]